MLGPELVGDLYREERDMFWVRCRFVPGPRWPEARAPYEAFARWRELREPDPEGTGFAEVVGPIAALGLELEAPDGTRMPVPRRAFVWVYGETADVRC